MSGRRKGEGGLTAGQRMFVHEYLVDLNARAAAFRCGMRSKSEGSDLLRLPHISKAIDDELKKLTKRSDVQAVRVIEELKRLAFSDIGDYVDWGPRGVVLKASGELSVGQSRAVMEVQVTENRRGGKTTHFKLASKQAALDALAKYLGMYGERKPADEKPADTRVLGEFTTDELRDILRVSEKRREEALPEAGEVVDEGGSEK